MILLVRVRSAGSRLLEAERTFVDSELALDENFGLRDDGLGWRFVPVVVMPTTLAW